MLLNGQCVKDFEKWAVETQDEIYLENRIHLQVSTGYGSVSFYYSTPLSMQYGLYVDFFDDLTNREDIIGRICILIMETQKGFAYTINGSISETYPTRQEARNEAIIKANNIYNGK